MKKILIGLSGGIDSAAIALDFIEKGYRVEGITFIFSELKRERVLRKSKNISSQLGIKTHIIDLREEFKKNIEQYFADAYKKGFTPNPCAMCNRLMKFPYLEYYRKKMKFDYFSTGHYVSIKNGIIEKAFDSSKDQSYFVSIVKKEHIKHFINSRNAYKTKRENKEFLQSRNIKMDYVSESQDICFIKTNYIEYLQKEHNFQKSKGNFVDTNNNVLGQHNGYYYFTTGKRKGIGIGFNKKMYVKSIDPSNNKVCLVDREHLRFNGMEVLILEKFFNVNENIYVKTRYRQKETLVKRIEYNKNKIICEFEEFQNDVTPGQIAAFYHNKSIMLSGIIIKQL